MVAKINWNWVNLSLRRRATYVKTKIYFHSTIYLDTRSSRLKCPLYTEIKYTSIGVRTYRISTFRYIVHWKKKLSFLRRSFRIWAFDIFIWVFDCSRSENVLFLRIWDASELIELQNFIQILEDKLVLYMFELKHIVICSCFFFRGLTSCIFFSAYNNLLEKQNIWIQVDLYLKYSTRQKKKIDRLNPMLIWASA